MELQKALHGSGLTSHCLLKIDALSQRQTFATNGLVHSPGTGLRREVTERKRKLIMLPVQPHRGALPLTTFPR